MALTWQGFFDNEPSSFFFLPAVSVIATISAVGIGSYYYFSRLAQRRTGSVFSEVFLDRSRKRMLLTQKIAVSRDTRIFRFALEHPSQVLGLPIGKHLKLYCLPPNTRTQPGHWNFLPDAEDGECEVTRNYTPITGDETPGFVDFIIKIYKGKEKDKFPDGGKMSQHLDGLRVGKDSIEVSGPVGHIEYRGMGRFQYLRRELVKSKVGMLAGGTGITPMLQIIRHVLRNPQDVTEISLLFANQTPDDILLKSELDSLAELYPKRFAVWYTVDRLMPGHGENWKWSTGFITEEMIRSHLPPPSKGVVILLCGPPPMCKYACRPALESIGYLKDDTLEF